MEKEQLTAELTAALRAENIDQLKTLGRQAVENYENEPFGYYFLGESALLSGNYENAEILLAKAIELDENNDDLRLRFAAVKEAKGEHEDACIVYVMVLEHNPQNLAALLGLARFYLEQDHDGEEAVAYIQQALAINPNHEGAQLLYIRALLAAEQFDEALVLADKAIASTNSEAAYLLKISILSNLKDNLQPTAQAYKALLAAHPNASHTLNYANFLLSNGQYAQAEPLLQQLVDAHFDPVTAELLAVCMVEQGKPEGAIAIFSQIIELMPEEWSAYSRRANAYLSAKNGAAALADLKKAEQYVSAASRPDLQLQLANLYLHTNQFKEAYNQFKNLTDGDALPADGFFGMAQVYQKSNSNPDKAFEALLRAVSLRHPKAQAFMEQHYATQLEQHEQKLLSTVNPAQNAASAALQPLFNKLWRYNPAINPADNMPAELVKRLQQAVADTTIIITPNGIAIANPYTKKAQLGAYKIEKESPAAAQILVSPLDGSKPYSVQVGPKGAYLFYRPTGSTEAILLKDSQPQPEAAMLKKYFNSQQLAFLGDSAAEILAAL